MASRMDRRRFLRGAAGAVFTAAAGGALAACGDDDDPKPDASATIEPSALASATSGATPPAQGTARATSTTAGSPVPPDWTALDAKIEGEVIVPGAASYDARRTVFNPRYDSVKPAAIARCLTADDVARCVDAARKGGVPIALRSGGHSYAGYSTGTGLVIDTGAMRGIKIESGNKLATVGAGTRLIDVYAGLAQFGLALPAGSCPTVGITGLALGGGIGVLDRSLGLTCDNIESVEVVTAEGKILQCSAAENSDLYWACRGGGGGSFGVVTAITFQVYSQGDLTVFDIGFPWAAASDVLSAWQEWAPDAPDELWANCLLGSTSAGAGGTPSISVNGVYKGSLANANTQLEALAKRLGSTGERAARPVTLLDAMRVEAGCARLSLAECHLPIDIATGKLDREASYAASAFFSKSLSADGVKTLLATVESRQADGRMPGGGVILDPMGGAIGRVAEDATAFVHRKQRFSAQYYAPYAASNTALASANQLWVRQARTTMAPFASGSAYVNYIDPEQPDWQKAYYGSNLARLKMVKAKYDPDNVFRHGQSIP